MLINIPNVKCRVCEWLNSLAFRALLILMCVHPGVNAQENWTQEDNEDAIKHLISVLAKSNSIQADVEQLTLDQGGVELEEVTARLVMEKPDHFYWALLEPYEQLTVTNGEKIWIYEPDLDQVTIQFFERGLGRTPLSLLTDDIDTLRLAYWVSMDPLPDNLGTRYLLLPKEPGSQLESLSLTFYGDVLEQMQYETTLGQKTSLTFSNMEINMELDPGVFEFDPPGGIEIIDTTQN